MTCSLEDSVESDNVQLWSLPYFQCFNFSFNTTRVAWFPINFWILQLFSVSRKTFSLNITKEAHLSKLFALCYQKFSFLQVCHILIISLFLWMCLSEMKFSMKNFWSKYDQIRNFRIWLYLLKKSLMQNFTFYEGSFIRLHYSPWRSAKYKITTENKG